MNLGQFTEEEFDAVFKNIKNKLLASMKYALNFGRQENSVTHFYDYVTQYKNKTL